MNSSISETGTNRARSFLVGLVGLGLLALVALFLLFRQPSTPQARPEPPPIPDACLEQLRAQQQLGILAVRSMETYGRIDAGLFVPSSDSEAIRVSPEAKPLEVPDGAGSMERFRGALASINGDGGLLKRLRDGYTRAVRDCGEGCPPNVYSIDVELVNAEKNPYAGFYKWHVKGTVPTNKEWQLGFLQLYGSAPTLSCPYDPVLELVPREVEKKLAQAAGAAAPASASAAANSPNPQTAVRGLQPQERSESPQDFASGTAATATPCDSKTHHSCDLCRLSTGYGGMYFNGSKWCCGNC